MKRPKGPSRQSNHMVLIRPTNTEWSTWWDKWWGLGVFAPLNSDGSQGENLSARQIGRSRRMKRPAGASAAGLPSLALYTPSATLSRFKTLDSLLFDPNWDDATPKGQRCLMAFIDDLAIRLLVKLENDCLKASCVGRTWDDTLATMDQLLKSGTVVWEQDRPRPQQQQKKKK